MKTTNAIVREVYPIIEKAISKNINAYKRNLQVFFQKRSKSIYDVAPYDRIVFGENDANDFFRSLQINKRDILKGIQNTYYWRISSFNPRAAKDEFTIAVLMVIRYFIIKNDMKNAELSSIYLSFSGKFYPSIHSGKWRVAPPSENRHVMDYVINNMLTNKFDLKREGSVFGAIRSLCVTWLDSYIDIFKSDLDDEEVKDLIQQLHGRIKSFLGNIATLFYDAYEKGNYLSYDSDADNENSFRMADTNSLQIERYVENTMNFINTNTVDYTLCKMASDTNVKVDEVKSIIEGIQNENSNIPLVKELLRILVSEYVASTGDKEIVSYKFVTWAISAKPNSKNKNIIRQKEIIEHWLDETSPQYRKRKSRAATKSSYYKSVLFYYVLAINKANK
ncbi:MAG: hypothetical protein PHC62_00020 [Candidatus Izemoplasmatales bacterium]|nr:hypothetical protein [Candidatus Izemoplasmatales bacterium]